MDERTEQGRRFLMGYRDDDTTEFVSDQEKKLPQPPSKPAARVRPGRGSYRPASKEAGRYDPLPGLVVLI